MPPRAVARKLDTRKRSDASLGPVLDFMRLIWALDHGLQSSSKRMEARLGVTGPQRLAVRMLGRFPGISAGKLATLLHVHPSTLTGILQRLDGAGLVARKADAADKRRALFFLTAKGRGVDDVKAGTTEAAIRRALADLPDAKINAAREVMGSVVRELSRGLAR